MIGPYHTERQARADVEHVGRGSGPLRQHLLDACTELGVTLGAYDLRTLGWLAGWEAEMVQVVVGLIRRAHEAGQAPAPRTARPILSTTPEETP